MKGDAFFLHIATYCLEHNGLVGWLLPEQTETACLNCFVLVERRNFDPNRHKIPYPSCQHYKQLE